MGICYLDTLRKSSKKKEMGIEKKVIEMLQQASNLRKKTGKEKIGMFELLILTLYLLPR